MAIHEFDYDKEPTVSIVKQILNDSIKMKATDIHFDPTEDELIIKFRINNDLIEYTTAPDSVKVNITTRVKILAGMNITESLLPQIGTLNIDVDSLSRTMRVSSLPVADGEKLVCHITNYTNSVKAINKLGFNDKDNKKIKSMLKEDQGIILVTGNANSGKTTTIYSILKEKNNKDNNIISIEDPINMKIKGINQVEICPEKGLTYRNILKSIPMQDPNIIAINELVDDETTRFALRASLSGRLVISSLQTKTVYQTIENLLHIDVENYLLGSNLKGIISQRLAKRLCPMCREKKRATDYEKKVIKEILGIDIKDLYVPSGCDDCKDGYIGLIPVAEVALIDSELKHAIANNKNLDLIKKIIYSNNQPLIIDGFNKVVNGDTSFQEIIRILDFNTDIDEDNEELKSLLLGKEENDEITPEETSTSNEENNYKEESTEISSYEEDNSNTEDTYPINEEESTEEENNNYYNEENTEEQDIEEEQEETPIKDAAAEMNDAKELLNRLMGQSKRKKNPEPEITEENTEEIDGSSEEQKENEETETSIETESVTEKEIKKSSFNLDDVDDDDDDDDFNYSGYENSF